MNNSNLPWAMLVAAAATELDNIRIVSVTEDTGIKATVSVFKFGDWEARLIDKCADVLNADIIENMLSNPELDLELHAYILASPPSDKGRFKKSINMHYKII